MYLKPVTGFIVLLASVTPVSSILKKKKKKVPENIVRDNLTLRLHFHFCTELLLVPFAGV